MASDQANAVLANALQLPQGDREHIAGQLFESLTPDEWDEDPAIKAAWMEEIARRCNAVDAGEVELIDAADVHRDARAAAGRYAARQNK